MTTFAWPDADAIGAAAARIAGHAHRTPVLRARSLERDLGCELHFKAEHLQRAGAFKFRGAANAIFGLAAADARRGVVTQSSGNHGAAVALACAMRGIPCTVVVPGEAPRVKLEAIRRHGARIVPCDVPQAARDAVSARVLAETGGHYVPPFEDPRIVAGQATATLELLEAVPDIELVVSPVSGGGLASGAALALAAFAPRARLVGAEPAGAADAHASLAAGHRITGLRPDTICDGLRAELGPTTFEILRRHAEAILTVPDARTLAAMRMIWERLKQVVEPSGAIGLAAILEHPERFRGRRVGVILSGGNVDLDRLPW